jgi:hypothetical protein
LLERSLIVAVICSNLKPPEDMACMAYAPRANTAVRRWPLIRLVLLARDDIQG